MSASAHVRRFGIVAGLVASICGANPANGPLSELADPAHPLPAFRFATPPHDFYLPQARREGKQGDVLVAFSVDAQGKATAPFVFFTDHDILAPWTLQLLAQMRFDTTAVGQAVSPSWRRYRLLFRYQLSGSAKCEQAPPSGLTEVAICATRLPGLKLATRSR